MPISVWPSSPKNCQRLREFQASPHYPARYQERSHAVSQLWLQAVKGIYAFPGSDFIAIHSLSGYVAPEERVLRELSRQRRRYFDRLATIIGRLGTAVPKWLWILPDRIARTWLRGSAWLNRARERECALQAFSKVVNNQCPLNLLNMGEVRIFAEQFKDAPALTLYFASVINALHGYLKTYRVKRVLEIGPGEGVLALALNQWLGQRFILIDLPEVLTITYAMISYYAPDATIILPHEVEDHNLQCDADFVLLVPEQAESIPDCSIDLAVNMSSFQEMTYDLIQRYFSLIERCVRPGGLFYCLNEAKFQRHRDGQDIEFTKFPWSHHFRDLLWEDFVYWSALGGRPKEHRLQVKQSIEDGGCA